MLLLFIEEDDYLTFLTYMGGIDSIASFYEYFKSQWGPNGRVNREYWRYSENERTDDIITNDGAENFNGQVNISIGKQPTLCICLNKLYEYNDGFYRINFNDTVTKRSIDNKYHHYSAKEAKAEINKSFPQIWKEKLKPTIKRNPNV